MATVADQKQREAYTLHQAAHDAVDNQHLLCLMASKRARELQQGSAPRVDIHPGQKVTTIAIKEIALGMYTEDHYNGLVNNAEEELIAAINEEDNYGTEHSQSNTFTE
jgi:DNA-directed RNA polymerase omega subunit